MFSFLLKTVIFSNRLEKNSTLFCCPNLLTGHNKRGIQKSFSFRIAKQEEKK